MVVAAGVYAQTTDKEKKHTKSECTFVDKKKDGKGDVCGSTNRGMQGKREPLPLKAPIAPSVRQLQNAGDKK
jgi:hypothetical protein